MFPWYRGSRRRPAWAAMILAILMAYPRPARPSSETLETAEGQAFRRAAHSVTKSVVRIQAVGGVDVVDGMVASSAATTGVIISSDGFILSSAFNFIGRPTSILVQLENGKHFSARLVATDHLRMLTLLKIDATGLTPLKPASSHRLRVGQWAIAIGRTYESPEPSISVGIVSAVNRVWGKAIQTDAKVSPVNYGGPLIDVAGDILGILVPLSPTGKEEAAGVEWYDSGIGFAIPYEEALASAERLKSGKDLRPGLLGVTVREGGIDDPATIDVVRFDSPAERAGLKSGDVFVALDGHPVRRHDEIKLVLGRKYAGDTVAVVVQRGAQQVSATTQLVDRLVPYQPGFLGFMPQRQSADGAPGVGVRYVFPHSPAADAGITVDDRIRKWNGTNVTDAGQLAALVRRVGPGKKASVVSLRGGKEKTLSVTLAPDIEAIPADLPAFRAALPAKEAKKGDNKPKTGLFHDALPGESDVNYWAYVPDSYSAADSWGLVVWIAPARDAMESTILARWKGPCEQRRLLILAPLPAEATGFNPNDLVGARKVLDHFVATYRIDPNRIVVHGFATGGPFASIFSAENRELIRGLALASSPVVGAPPDSHPNYPLRFFLSCGAQERLVERLRQVAEVLRGLKFPVTLQTTQGRERSYPAADETAELARWIDSLDRI